MCAYSNVADGIYDKWKKWIPDQQPYTQPNVIPWVDPTIPYETIPIPSKKKIQPPVKQLTQKEVDELRELLKKAKEQDIKENNPDCELEEKKQKIRDLAKLLGYEGEIDFP